MSSVSTTPGHGTNYITLRDEPQQGKQTYSDIPIPGSRVCSTERPRDYVLLRRYPGRRTPTTMRLQPTNCRPRRNMRTAVTVHLEVKTAQHCMVGHARSAIRPGRDSDRASQAPQVLLCTTWSSALHLASLPPFPPPTLMIIMLSSTSVDNEQHGRGNYCHEQQTSLSLDVRTGSKRHRPRPGTGDSPRVLPISEDRKHVANENATSYRFLPTFILWVKCRNTVSF